MKRRKDMRQKYIISRDGPTNELRIREYAITDTKVKKPVSSTLKNERFALLCEETYEGKMILASISNGIKSLVAILRTHNLFPIEPYATKIAETVITLYKTSEYTSMELFFDDIDLVSVDMGAANN
jgi:hypothetical protein